MLTNIKMRLTVMNFLQFFVWGAWLTTIGTYCTEGKGWTFPQFGAIFSTLAISSLFMPSLIGIIADKWIRAERLYGVLHILYGIILFVVPKVEDPGVLFYAVFGAMICYMPTISLANSISYRVLSGAGLNVLKTFPPIRVYGTVGFIAAMLVTNQSGSNVNANQFVIAAIGAVLLGMYAFTLPACPPEPKKLEKQSLANQLGLNAFKLFANYKMALFFIFSMLLGAALQLSNMYGDTYLHSFPEGSFIKDNSTSVLAISQASETLFILTIPFFLKRFGIKNVMLFAMVAWVIRYAFFAWGEGESGAWMIVLSCVVYGLAFDFFNISGSMFIETGVDSSIRSSAQGLFMMMTNGFGAYIGTVASSWIIGKYFILPDGSTNWHDVWLVFAGYSLAVAVLFMLLFRHKHDPEALKKIRH